MMTRDERLRYWEKIESARLALLADPEIAAEYIQARNAWDSTISPAIVEGQPAPPENGRTGQPRRS